jgi:hypothetical protein
MDIFANAQRIINQIREEENKAGADTTWIIKRQQAFWLMMDGIFPRSDDRQALLDWAKERQLQLVEQEG